MKWRNGKFYWRKTEFALSTIFKWRHGGVNGQTTDDTDVSGRDQIEPGLIRFLSHFDLMHYLPIKSTANHVAMDDNQTVIGERQTVNNSTYQRRITPNAC